MIVTSMLNSPTAAAKHFFCFQNEMIHVSSSRDDAYKQELSNSTLREWCPGLQSWFRLIHEEINTVNNVTVRIKISVFDHQCPKTC
jgi:hypothetical protein